MTFEKWKMIQCIPDNLPHLDIVREAWQAATLAERERAAKVAESNIPAPPTPWGKGAAFNAEKIAATIRKGEEV